MNSNNPLDTPDHDALSAEYDLQQFLQLPPETQAYILKKRAATGKASLVQQNAAAFIAFCEECGIASEPDR